MTGPIEDSTTLTFSSLKHRGWTDGAIRRFLGDPDQTAPNPHYRSGPPMRLYNLARVKAAEATPEWKEWSEKSRASRSSASERMKAAMAERRSQLLEEVAALPITLPEMDMEELFQRAVDHRNGLGPAGDDWEGWDHARVDDADHEALERWAVNYLRHVATGYDTWLDALVGRIGRSEATELLREQIYGAIAKTYPELAGECDRQEERRTFPDFE